MIIIDKALKVREEQHKPIRVAILGAGFMGQGLTNQIVNSVPGMRMSAVYNRHPDRAVGVYRYAGMNDASVCTTQASLDAAIRRAGGSSDAHRETNSSGYGMKHRSMDIQVRVRAAE